MESFEKGYDNGTLLFFETVAGTVIWWTMYMSSEPLFRALCPKLYKRLASESREKMLVPAILFALRILIGLTITFPACAYAGFNSPWGLGVPLSRAGEVCVASQVTVWSTELGLLLPYSFELFVHHVVCLVVTAHVVWSPPVHPVRPLYVLFATQLGDLPPCGILLLKMAGLRPMTSRLLYGFTLATTAWILGSKVTGGLWVVGNALQNPNRAGDWAWALAVLFWVYYCLLTIYKNLKWLHVLKPDPLRPYALLVCGRSSVPLSHLLLGLGFAATMVSTLAVYGIHHGTRLTHEDMKNLGTMSAIAAALGLTGAMVLKALLPVDAAKTDPWGRDMYLQWGRFMVGWWAFLGTSMLPDMNQPVLLSCLALHVPLLQAASKAAHYLSARDASTRFFLPGPNEKPLPAAPAMKRLPEHVAAEHMDLARSHFTMFLVAVGLMSYERLDLTEAALLAVVAFLAHQALRSPFMVYRSLEDASLATFVHALLSCVGTMLEATFLVYVAAWDSRYATMASEKRYLVAGTVAAGLAADVLFRGRKKSNIAPEKISKDSKKDKKNKTADKKKPLISPVTFTLLFLGALQIAVGQEVLRYNGDKVVPEPGTAFLNFRDVLTSPRIWGGVMGAAVMPVLLFGILDYGELPPGTPGAPKFVM